MLIRYKGRASVVRLVFFLASAVRGLDNGLARTPPMGWMSWGRFRCQTNCFFHPSTCISEDLYKNMADRLVADGYRKAGYNTVHIDDCYTQMKRCGDELCADSSRFPSDIDGLADYMHDRGLRLGVYANFGTATCEGYPGSIGHLAVDAQTFARWRSDYLKFDGCNSDVADMEDGYHNMQLALNATGRPIAYSCGWPLYFFVHKRQVDYTKAQAFCNSWRNFHDIEMSWDSILGIIDFYDANPQFADYHGPGGWFDPDMIVAGNPEITVDQARAQLSVWAIWSAPLIMSNDLRDMPAGHAELLLNQRMIAIDQDPLGRMGRLVDRDDTMDVSLYVKPMTPTTGKDYSYALALLNRGQTKRSFRIELQRYGLNHTGGYVLEDVWGDYFHGIFLPADVVTANVNPTGAVLLKATPAALFRFTDAFRHRPTSPHDFVFAM